MSIHLSRRMPPPLKSVPHGFTWRDIAVEQPPQPSSPEGYTVVSDRFQRKSRILSALGVDVGKRIYTKGGIAALKAKVKVF